MKHENILHEDVHFRLQTNKYTSFNKIIKVINCM